VCGLPQLHKLRQDNCGLYSHIRGIPISYGNVDSLTAGVRTFVEEGIAMCQPDQVHICDGSEQENKMLIKSLLEAGTIVLGIFLAAFADPGLFYI